MDSIYKYQPLWGDWYIDEFLGEGSFGKVYKISKESLGRKHYCAVKLISVPTEEQKSNFIHMYGTKDKKALDSYSDDIVQKIADEIEILNKFKGNTNILSYDDHLIFKRENCGYDILIKMEYLNSLDKAFKDGISLEKIIDLGCDICTALEICHKNNIIHRDVKEENIFYSDLGNFKLGDFGISKESAGTLTSTTTGTYSYMAPEILKGEKYDLTVDFYSLGIVLYKMINNGKMPFVEEKFNVQMMENAQKRRLNGEKFPEIIGVSDTLNNILNKACSLNSKDRFQNAHEFKNLLIEEKSKLNERILSKIFYFNNINSSLYSSIENKDVTIAVNENEDKTKKIDKNDRNEYTKLVIKNDSQNNNIIRKNKIIIALSSFTILTMIFAGIFLSINSNKKGKNTITKTGKITVNLVENSSNGTLTTQNLTLNNTIITQSLNTDKTTNIVQKNSQMASNNLTPSVNKNLTSAPTNTPIMTVSMDFDGTLVQKAFGNGNSEDQYLIGDWNGDRKATVAARRGMTIVMDYNGSNIVEKAFGNGNSEDQYLVGDWNGDGKDTIAVRRGMNIVMDYDGSNIVEKAFGNGNSEDQYLVGDWNGDGRDTVAVRRSKTIVADYDGKNIVEKVFGSGNSEDQYLAGDWNGDKFDTVAVRRGNTIIMDWD